MIIETCPECGVDLMPCTFATYPPIHAWHCPKCGWRYEGRDVVKRVPFSRNKKATTHYDLLVSKTPEEMAEFLAALSDPEWHMDGNIYDATKPTAESWIVWLKQEVDRQEV